MRSIAFLGVFMLALGGHELLASDGLDCDLLAAQCRRGECTAENIDMLTQWCGADEPAGWAQVTMMNRAGVTLDLYVDDVNQCRALSALSCTAQVQSGYRTLEARKGGTVYDSTAIVVEKGHSYTWTVEKR